MAEIEDQVQENLRALQAESGVSWDVLAVDMDNYDPAVAAWMREQGGGSSAPKSRKAAPKSEA